MQRHEQRQVRRREQQQRGDHQVADDQDGEIGRAVIGRILGQVLTAGLTGGLDLQITSEDAAFITGRAVAKKAAGHGLSDCGAFGLGHGGLYALLCNKGKACASAIC